MRFLKVLTIGMGVLIVVATTVLVVVIARRIGGAGRRRRRRGGAAGRARGDADRGDRLGGDRLAVQLQGGGADRVVLVDPRTGAVAGRIGLRTP